MHIVQIDDPFFHHVLIGTKAERLALTSPFPYTYDEFIEEDTNSHYLWGGSSWLLLVSDPSILLSQRFGALTASPPLPAPVTASFSKAPMPVDTSLGGGAGIPYIKFLTINGLAGDPRNLNGNYSAAPVKFFFQTPANSIYFIKVLTIQISSPNVFTQENYGGIGGGLVNGVSLSVTINSVEIPLLSGFIFHTNNDWFGITSHIQLHTFSGQTNTLVVEFLMDDWGSPLIIKGGDRINITLNDDFRALTLHRMTVKGSIVSGVV